MKQIQKSLLSKLYNICRTWSIQTRT